jgi:hypothetical protein
MEDSTGGLDVPRAVLAGLLVFGALLTLLAGEEPGGGAELSLATD